MYASGERAAGARVTTVVLYGRDGLLPVRRRPRAAAASARADTTFVLIERDIEADEALLKAYLERIPVVTIDGEEAFELLVDEAELERWLGRVESRMSYTVGRDDRDVVSQPGAEKPGEKLSLGVAARLSRYLQVLTQARKMGRDTISSQELADYTHVNSTQIRRDLSGFGKFGKRGVGYNVDSLVTQIRKILRTAGQHNIALFGAGHLGTAIATSDIFADHGFRRRGRVRRRSGQGRDRDRPADGAAQVRPAGGRRGRGHRRRRARGALGRGAGARRRARRRGREDHLQLLRGAAPGPARGHRAHLEPGRRPALRAVLLPDVVDTAPRAHRP